MKRFVWGIVFLLCLAGPVHAQMVSIVGELVNMRSGPGNNYAVLWELGQGYPLKVLEDKGEWLNVTDFENDSGWVHKDMVSRKAYMVVKKRIINVRSGPGENYPIIRQAQKGVVFRTLERQDSWVKVRHEEENITGWVSRSLLWGW